MFSQDGPEIVYVSPEPVVKPYGTNCVVCERAAGETEELVEVDLSESQGWLAAAVFLFFSLGPLLPWLCGTKEGPGTSTQDEFD